MAVNAMHLYGFCLKIVSRSLVKKAIEFDEAIPQSRTVHQSTAPYGRVTGH